MQELTAGYQADKYEFVKSPVIAEFLGFPEDKAAILRERELEDAIISNIQRFLLEMGKGYAFVARQKHIHTEKEEYFIDLVFYNFILKCFVLIDLKTSKVTHQDVGQMDMYVRMYDELVKDDSDGPTLGIVLCADTDEDIARADELAYEEIRQTLATARKSVEASINSAMVVAYWQIGRLISERIGQRAVETKYYERLLHTQEAKALQGMDDVEKARSLVVRKARTDDTQTNSVMTTLKDPYVFDFLGVGRDKDLLESELESLLIDSLHDFLLELGRGFAYVGRQHRVNDGGITYRIDLVFYNYSATAVMTDGRLRDFTVEMETGTGKTYCYTRTIFELNKRYGITKFLIVVPSVAIRSLNPLFVPRYSATHKEGYNKVYRLTPVDAFQQGLVKGICVDSVLAWATMPPMWPSTRFARSAK